MTNFMSIISDPIDRSQSMIQVRVAWDRLFLTSVLILLVYIYINFDKFKPKNIPKPIINVSEKVISNSISFTNPLDTIYVTSPYGYRRDPFTGNRSFHTGVDLRGWYGTKIRSVSEGRVIEIAYSRIYGNMVRIKHSDGYVTMYAHLGRIYVSKGQSVSIGEVIGVTGSTGRSNGPHLHFEVVKDGCRIDPMKIVDYR